MKLHWKIYLASCGFVLLTAVSLTAAVILRESNEWTEELRTQKFLLAEIGASQIEAGYHEKLWPFEMLHAISGDESITGWRVVDGAGVTVLGSDEERRGQVGAKDIPADTRTPLHLVNPGNFEETWVIPLTMRTGQRPWAFHLSYTRAHVAERIDRLTMVNVAAAAGITIFMLPMVLILTRRFLRPLTELINAVDQYELGADAVQLPEATNDEVGHLIVAFQKMAERVHARDAQINEQLGVIRAARDELERRVEERTAELTARSSELEREVTERKRAQEAREKLHAQLLTASRQAGMAEVATGVLHNVGNVLNSINVSTELLQERVRKSRISDLNAVSTLIANNRKNLAQYVTRDERGRHLPVFIECLADHLSTEQDELLSEIQSLTDHIEHIKHVVSMQQDYSAMPEFNEPLRISDLVNDVLEIVAGDLDEHRIDVQCSIEQLPMINSSRHKLMQIMVHIVRNAVDALSEHVADQRRLTLTGTADNDNLTFTIADNGPGVPEGLVQRIYEHGFSTRKNGHGFGLHVSAIAARELGGSLSAHNNDDGGAAFQLVLPLVADPGRSTPQHETENQADAAA